MPTHFLPGMDSQRLLSDHGPCRADNLEGTQASALLSWAVHKTVQLRGDMTRTCMLSFVVLLTSKQAHW